MNTTLHLMDGRRLRTRTVFRYVVVLNRPGFAPRVLKRTDDEDRAFSLAKRELNRIQPRYDAKDRVVIELHDTAEVRPAYRTGTLVTAIERGGEPEIVFEGGR